MFLSRATLFAAAAAGTLLAASLDAKAQFFGDPFSIFDSPPSPPPSYDRRGGAAPRAPNPDDYQPHARPYERPRAGQNENRRVASLPPDADPAYSTPVDYDVDVNRRQATARHVADQTGEAPGVITIDTRRRKLYLSVGNGEAVEYSVGVGRQGFSWKGVAQIGRKAFWPGWTPPPEMLQRRPELPTHMDGGLNNPLGARALYLFDGVKDTMFRIHGTNEPDTVGKAVSSGCIRMLNADVIDLYGRVGKGTRVVVR